MPYHSWQQGRAMGIHATNQACIDAGKAADGTGMPDYASMSTEELLAMYDADHSEGWDASWLLEFPGVAEALRSR